METLTKEDVRNKLGPIKNLMSLIELDLVSGKHLDLILLEIEQCKKNIEYLTK